MTKKCPWCRNGTIKEDGREARCFDCDGTGELRLCPSCGEWLSLHDFEDGADVCGLCAETQEGEQ